MKTNSLSIMRLFFDGLKTAFIFSVLLGVSTVSAQTVNSFSAVPPLITDNAAPNIMFVMSNDHELYRKAYSDYSDLDGDGDIESTYDDNVTYAGYFDSNFCYSYNSLSDRFEPSDDISSLIATTGHSCDVGAISGDWSGNFMNWATMTRMDIVRHVLYGGKRDVDSAASVTFAGPPAVYSPGVTVLERSFIPEDVHSFSKVFAGDTE